MKLADDYLWCAGRCEQGEPRPDIEARESNFVERGNLRNQGASLRYGNTQRAQAPGLDVGKA